MKKRPRRGRWSILAGWLMVAFSSVLIIGIILTALDSSSAAGATPSGSSLPVSVTRMEENNATIRYHGSWRTSGLAGASAGKEFFAFRTDTSAIITFTGTSLSWVGTKSPKSGLARVTLDSGPSKLVDLYSATYAHRQVLYATGTLTARKHTLKIEWTGKKNPRSTGTRIYIDAVDVSAVQKRATTSTTQAPATTTTAAVASAARKAAAPATTTTTVRATTTTTTAAPAATSTTAPKPTTSTTAVPQPAVYDVRQYGAKGDGVADDAKAIQSAVEAARAAGGGTVYLPAGTYRLFTGRTLDPDLGANIELYDNITVKGAGPASTTVVATCDWASAFGAMRRTNVRVQDLTVTAKGSQQDGVKFGICTDAYVGNVVAHDIYIGVAYYSCIGGVVKDSKFYDCWGSGVWIGQAEIWTEPTKGGLIEDCEGWGSNFTSFRVAGKVAMQARATGVTVRRCYSHTDGANVGFLFSYVGSVKVEDSTSTGDSYHGVRFAGVAGATVTGSTAPFVSTLSNDPNMYASYGASSGVVLQ
jgi:hypothetical protein